MLNGVAKTSSYTNTPQAEEGINQISAHSFLMGHGTKVKKSISHGGAWRLASHALVVAGAIFIVAAGKIQAESITGLKGGGRGATSTEDQSTMLAAGAILAEQSHSLIAADVKERAVTVAGQAKLATAGESFLSKRAPIASGGVANRTVSIHTVAGGETISAIAQKYGVTSDTVLWANDLATDAVLKPGSKLTILPVNGLLYSVTGGETLEELASRYQASANLIDSFNQLEGKPLAVGQKIIIPDGIKPDNSPDPAPVTRLASVAAKPKPTIANFKPTFGGNSYTRGYCTYYVAGRRSVPGNWGNASQWYYNAIASGYSVGATPQAGAIAQTSGGWGGYGHVAYVESVNGGMVTVSEMNYNGGWNRVSSRTVPASTFRYIY
jgi:surface antigen